MARTKHTVELLLAENVPHLGTQGEIVGVKAGYARNYLIPQGLATVATTHNKRMVEQHKIRIAELEADRLKSIKELASNVSKYSVTLEANANQEGHLYGSITAPEISKALKAATFNVEAEHIKLEGPLKELGMYTVKLEFHEKIKADVKVWVVPAVNK